MIYGIKGAVELSADLVIEKGDNTYVCNFDPTKVNRTSGAPAIESQEVWQIICYSTTQIIDGQDVINKTQALYPDGSCDYKFAPNNIDNLNFRYRL